MSVVPLDGDRDGQIRGLVIGSAITDTERADLVEPARSYQSTHALTALAACPRDERRG